MSNLCQRCAYEVRFGSKADLEGMSASGAKRTSGTYPISAKCQKLTPGE